MPGNSPHNMHLKTVCVLKYKTLVMALLLISAITIMGLGNSLLNVLLINCFVVLVYLFFKPTNIFHPNNIVFAFSFLHMVLPSSIQLVYEIFEIPYMLPWGKVNDFFSYELSTYYSMFFLYMILYFSFYFLNQKDFPARRVVYLVNARYLFILFLFTVVMLFYYMQLTGGFLEWVTNYKRTFLLGRDGLGLISFTLLFTVNLLVFLLGLYFHKKDGGAKLLVLFIALLFIIFASLLQGLKSRIIILLIIFFFPYLLHIKLKFSKLLLLGVLFFVILYIGTYIRSDGFYNTPLIFIEYIMTYFNAYELHDMVASHSEPGFLTTAHHVFVRPLIALDLINQNAEYDISVTLTKVYFPNDWETMSATQQWPLITELYYNYYGFVLGWFPLMVYAFILTVLYKKTKSGNIALALIFILEFIRLFTVQRGVLIPWQMPVYLFFYMVFYFAVKIMVRVVYRYEK